jgi:hypothetical protein
MLSFSMYLDFLFAKRNERRREKDVVDMNCRIL